MNLAHSTNDSLGSDMLFDFPESHEKFPTNKTVPQALFVISVGIVHKLWVFVWSKESIGHGGITRFVIELEQGAARG